MNMKKMLLCLLLLLLPLAARQVVPAKGKSQFQVITWGGNSQDWNEALHLSGVRIGCSDAVASCLREVSQTASSQHVSSVILAVLLNPARILSDSASYAQAAGAQPALVEVGFDDFVSQSEKTKLDPGQLSGLLEKVAGNLKSGRAKVRFGITVYQDQLTSGELDSLQLSEAARRSVDVVHLFPHYRKEAQPLAEYVAKAKQVFPNAKVLLGNYAYDRREYLPCSRGARAACSREEEINLFEQNLLAGLSIANRGDVDGIELFPGNFGGEDSWKGWNNPRACKQGERDLCVQNTIAMRNRLREAIR